MAHISENQIYEIVNTISKEALGSEDIQAVDNASLIALGNTILSSANNTDHFLNTLVQRIGRTIISARKYNSIFGGLMVNDFEWGNILQKISFKLIEAETDPSYGLTNGQSVDPWKINKPEVVQKLFTSETPYMFSITIQDTHLSEAFTSASSMGAFIQGIFTSVQNSIELALENLGRNCMVNFIAETNGTDRAINLLDKYNTETNHSLTTTTCMTNPDFLRYCVEQIKLVSTRMTSMSTIFNDGSVPRHTPKSLQMMYVLADFEQRLESVVTYSAFHKDYVSLNNFTEVPFWQSINEPYAITTQRASDSSDVEMAQVLCVLFDKEALGIYKKERKVATTPINGRGLYYNTFYHLREMYFNDLSENGVVFYIAEA